MADYNAEMNVALPRTTEPNRKFCSVRGRSNRTFGWISGKMRDYFSTLTPGPGPFPSKFPKFGLQNLPSCGKIWRDSILIITSTPFGLGFASFLASSWLESMQDTNGALRIHHSSRELPPSRSLCALTCVASQNGFHSILDTICMMECAHTS